MSLIATAFEAAVLVAEVGGGFTPTDFGAAIADAVPSILGYIAIGVAAGIPVMLAMIGINRGIGSFQKTAKKG